MAHLIVHWTNMMGNNDNLMLFPQIWLWIMINLVAHYTNMMGE